MNESIVFTECPEDLAKEIWYYVASLGNSVKLLLCHSRPNVLFGTGGHLCVFIAIQQILFIYSFVLLINKST
jgi:hypothetical protein